MKSYTGCSGFHYKNWKGDFYPEDLKQKEWLPFYARHFNTVEINNTFYNTPKKSTFENWLEQTPKGFRFAVKGSRYVTHLKKLRDSEEHTRNFYQAIEPLAEKINAVLWQLPRNQHRDVEKIEKFCQSLSKDFVSVIEFRHPSWFEEKIYELLAKYNVVTCSLSAPDNLPEVLENKTGKAYLRLHGKKNWYDYYYAESELKKWSGRIKKSNIKEIYIYFNNDMHTNAVKNGNMMKEYLEE